MPKKLFMETFVNLVIFMGTFGNSNYTIGKLTSRAMFTCMICEFNPHKLNGKECSNMEDLPIFMSVEKNRQCQINQ